MSVDAAVAAYEEFRNNKEYDDEEEKLLPWSMLTVGEQRSWIEMHRIYTGNGEHGDPGVTQHNKPRVVGGAVK